MPLYVGLLLNLYRNLNPSSFLLLSKAGSFAFTCSDSVGDVLKAPVDSFLLNGRIVVSEKQIRYIFFIAIKTVYISCVT